METKLFVPPVIFQYHSRCFSICDESRVIAAEYKGGLKNYPDISKTPTVKTISSTLTSSGAASTTINGITSTNTSAACKKSSTHASVPLTKARISTQNQQK